MKLEHVGIWVEDLERLRDFYQLYFQAKSGPKYCNQRKQFESYFLTFPSGGRIELMHSPGLAHRVEGERIGYAHLAVSVGSDDAVNQLSSRLASDGYPLLDGPRLTGDGYYQCKVSDPEGNCIVVSA